jgi:wyosine [tRNA(Phe)-imidazoG37] synthetase (radical SAM superfamily)
MAGARDTVTGHVPESLVYGPVESRRFGRSLGISLSPPDVVRCRWRCPYCQLGNLPWKTDLAWPEASYIVSDLQNWFATHPDEKLDAVTVAGSGEPSDHPDFLALSEAIHRICQTRNLPLVCLTNAEGLTAKTLAQAAKCYEGLWIKWDPGPNQGSWCRPEIGAGQDRRALFAELRPLRLQSFLFRSGNSEGNATASNLEKYLEDLAVLRPEIVHLSTASRPVPGGKVSAVLKKTLETWAKTIQARCACEVTCFE